MGKTPVAPKRALGRSARTPAAYQKNVQRVRTAQRQFLSETAPRMPLSPFLFFHDISALRA